jgi:outer membrane protein OmpA-like peptidoglycan-associated protein
MSTKPFAIALVALVSLAGCVAPQPYDQRTVKTDTYRTIDARLHDEPEGDAVRIEQLPHLVRLTLTDVLFSDDSASPSEAGKAVLARLGPTLRHLGDQRVVVKSFTDSVSIDIEPPERFPSTVPLTQARAAAVAELLRLQGVPATLVYTSGLGDSHVVASNDTPQGRARNRRVVIDIVAAPA